MAAALCCAAMTFTWVVGCGDSFSSGPDREGQQAAGPDYDQQVAELRNVVAQDPGSTKNQIRLAEVESKAADWHVARAEEFRGQKRLRDAQAELASALDLVPAHPKALTMRVAIQKELERAENLAKQAQAAADQQDFKTASRLATESAELDPALVTVTQIRDQVSSAAVKNNLDAAAKALEARQWDAALAAAAKVKEFEPSNAMAATIEKQVESRSAAMRMLGSARAAMEKKDYSSAVKLYEKAASLWPENAELTGERDQAVRTTAERAIAQADGEAAKDRYPAALGAIDEIQPVLPGQEDLAKRRADLHQRWNRSVLERYEKHALAGEWELAWVAAIEAAAVTLPGNSQNVQNLNRAEEMIGQALSYRLSVVPMKTSTVSPDVALGVCRPLADSIRTRKPSHVHLAELALPGLAIEESDLSPPPAAAPSSQPAGGILARKLPEADLALLVDVVANLSDSKLAGEPGASKFLAGRKNIQNPAYATAEVTLREARKVLNQARSEAKLNERAWDVPGRRALASEQTFAELAATGYYGGTAKDAADGYAAAVKARDEIPQWTQVDHWQEHRYPVQQISREVELRVRMRLVEVATAKVIWQDDGITSRASHADTQVDGDAVHNVTAKAANLKGSPALVAEAVAKVLPALQSKGGDVLARRPAYFLEQARGSSGDARIAAQVRFLFDSGPACSEEAAMAALTELFGSRASPSGVDACQRLALDRLHLRFPAVRSPVAQTRPGSPAPAVAQRPGQASASLSALARADQPRSQQETPIASREAGSQRKPSAPESSAARRASPARPVPAPPPSDRAADMNAGRVYQGIVSRDDDRYRKEVLTVDGIVVKLKDIDGPPLVADVDVTVGRITTRQNDLPIGTRMLIRGISGRRYELVVQALERKSETMWFTMQQTTLESLPR